MEWKTIDSASKDGTAFLGYQRINGIQWVIAPMYFSDDEFFMLAFHDSNEEFTMKPTHWMEIPDRPEGA